MANYEEYRDTALASAFTARMTPDQDVSERTMAMRKDVSERTMATRTIGGFEMVKHLVGGDWGRLDDERDKPLIKEVLTRALANAARNGIELDLDS